MGYNGDLYPTAGASVVMDTKGQIVRYNTEREAYNIGSTGDVLTVASGLPAWSAPAGGGTWTELVNETATDSAGFTTSSFDVKKFLHIQIYGYNYKTGTAGGGDDDNPNLMVTFNDEVYSDSNTSYSYELFDPASDARTAQNAIYFFAGNPDAPVNSQMFATMDISNEDSEDHITTWQAVRLLGTASSVASELRVGSSMWDDTTNITKVRFQLTATRGTMDIHIVVLGHD